MKGICFKEPLFHATVEGWKTQTRRIMKPQPEDMMDGQYVCRYVKSSNVRFDAICARDKYGDVKLFRSRYKVGEVLYLKEPYITLNHDGFANYTYYKFRGDKPFGDDGFFDGTWRWENKLFMPVSAARYFIRITAVRCERLQEISWDDCTREGIEHIRIGDAGACVWGISKKSGNCNVIGSNPPQAYAALIDKINGRGTWDSNPWVWVYDYELTEKQE